MTGGYAIVRKTFLPLRGTQMVHDSRFKMNGCSFPPVKSQTECAFFLMIFATYIIRLYFLDDIYYLSSLDTRRPWESSNGARFGIGWAVPLFLAEGSGDRRETFDFRRVPS